RQERRTPHWPPCARFFLSRGRRDVKRVAAARVRAATQRSQLSEKPCARPALRFLGTLLRAMARRPRAAISPSGNPGNLFASANCPGSLFARGESGCEAEGGEEIVGAGGALPGDVAGRAVADAGANDRQAERGIDGRIESEGLHRNVSLVVIHADEAISHA